MILRGLVLFCRPVFSYRLGAGGGSAARGAALVVAQLSMMRLVIQPWMSRQALKFPP
jgi:hypothetical protein